MEELLDSLRSIDTTTLSDAGKDLRVVDPALRPIALGRKLVGRAVTVAAGDGLLPVVEALERAGAGDVLVIDSGGAHARWPASCSRARRTARASPGS